MSAIISEEGHAKYIHHVTSMKEKRFSKSIFLGKVKWMSYIEFTFMYIEKALYYQSCGVTNHSYTIKRREIGKKTSPHISIIYISY